MENEMNLQELKNLAMQQHADSASEDITDEATRIVGADWMSRIGKPNDEQVTAAPESDNTDALPASPNLDELSYEGPGLVIDNADEETEATDEPVRFTGITPDTMAHVDAYLQEMDSNIAELKERREEIETFEETADEESDEEHSNSPMTRDEFGRRYDEAVVIIDKSGLGTVIDFSDADREKLDRCRKITLQEVETISLDTLKTKSIKRKTTVDTIIKNVTSMFKSNIVLPASGYTAVMRGCSAHELISLVKSTDSVVSNLQTKWSLIYDKIESMSIGKGSFNDFLLNTAAVDMDIFIYGILCATYPDDDNIPMTCTRCKKEFRHDYSIKSLIRAETMSDRLKDLIMNAVDNSYQEESARMAHENAPIYEKKIIRLPVTGIVVELCVQSAYDLINKSAKELASENRDVKYEDASILSTVVGRLCIPDIETNDGSYYEITDAMDITKTIYALPETDNDILTKMANDTLDGLSLEFGLMDITCPACKHFTPTVPMDIENILFYKYRQARSTIVE